MDMAKAAGAKILVCGFAGRDWELPLLEQRELGEFQYKAPCRENEDFAGVIETMRWLSDHADGNAAILVKTLQKVDASIDESTVRSMGTMDERCKIAQLIALESFFSGEEGRDDSEDEKKKAKGHATG